MLDYLSLLVMMNTTHLAGDSIIMHSLSSLEMTLKVVRDGGYTRVNTFLDNDRAGQKTTAKFVAVFGEETVISQSSLFEPYVDVNEALQAQNVSKF